MGNNSSQSSWHEQVDHGYRSSRAGETTTGPRGQSGYSRPMKPPAHQRYCLPQGKPSAPDVIPAVSDITHNSVTVSWFSPKIQYTGTILSHHLEICNRRVRRWKTVTKTCQGTTYTVRNLSPNTEYMFRVRVENLVGISKPSQTSDTVQTRSFESCVIEENDNFIKPKSKLVRRHSQHLHIEDGVTSLLCRTEYEPGESSNSNQLERLNFRRNSLRNMSLPLPRRKPVTSIMPGTRRESMCNLKESMKSLGDSTARLEEEGEQLQVQRMSISTEEECSNKSFSATSTNSLHEEGDSGDIRDTDSMDACDTNSEGSCTLMEDRLSVPCDIMTAPITDDTKLAFFRKSDSRHYQESYKSKLLDEDGAVWQKGRSHTLPMCSGSVTKDKTNTFPLPGNKTLPDLRSLRQMLNSHDVMVKTLNSANSSSSLRLRPPPTAIAELDEDDIAIDMVSAV